MSIWSCGRKVGLALVRPWRLRHVDPGCNSVLYLPEGTEMTPESSPFAPGRTVPVEFFVGRTDEIERLRSMVRGASQGRFGIGFVTGERGIGKSSLAGFVRWLSEQEKLAVGCHVPLGGVADLNGMLRTTLDRLLKDSLARPWHQQVRDFVGNRVRKVGLFGATLELDLQTDEIATLERNFAHSMRHLIAGIADDRSLFLVLDDINGLAQSSRFANWLKSVVDEISLSQEKTRLCILLVGLEERRRQLIEHQPSLARVFELIDIAPWADEEVQQFYSKTFAAAGAEVSKENLEMMVMWAGGLPALAHEIGDAVWRTAFTTTVRPLDVLHGVRLAAEVIGRKFLEPRILGAMRSERYLSILHEITDLPRVFTPNGFTRAEALERLSEDDKEVFDHFLRRMKKLGGLESVPWIRGGYRFPNLLHLLYFRIVSQRLAGSGGATVG